MQPIRSMLFVPADREDWVEGAPDRYPADAFIFDLEDAVAATPEAKRTARDVLNGARDVLVGADAVVTVRINGPGTDFFDDDLDAVVGPGVDAVVVPDLSTPGEVERVDHVLTHLERTRSIDAPIEVVALPETAYGLNNVYDLCAASDRVTVAVGASGENADPHREIGYEFTRGGRERQYLLSRTVMDARAAGIEELVAGVWMAVDDLDGLRAEAEFTRQLGYTGMMVIHPSHVEPVNEVFSPDPEAVERARRLVEAYEADDAVAAIRFEGDMIDAAHYKTALKLIDRAKAFGLG